MDGEVPASDSMESLMRAHGAALRSLCVRLLDDPALADDVVQQVFLQAHRDLVAFQRRASLRTWLFSIAVHRCRDAQKARRRYAARVTQDELYVESFECPDSDPGSRLEHTRLWAAVSRGLATLPARARTALALRFHHGLSYEEMSRVLGDKPDTLNARVTRAISALRRELMSQGWAP